MERISFAKVPSGIFGAMGQAEEYLKGISIDYKLLELMRIRVSQINGCAYCVDMHYKEAMASGEDLQRLYSVSCWKEAPYYSEKERSVLNWAEKVTLISQGPEMDKAFEELQKHFSNDEIANLTLAISTINTWNRLVISFGFEAGHYQVAQ